MPSGPGPSGPGPSGEPGRLLASGRDAEIFDLGGRSVLRRARDGRSLAAEAAVMAHAYDRGLPVPRVHEVTADGAIVMDRVDGPLLARDLFTRPWRVRSAGRILAELHEAVHRCAAPSDLPGVGLSGIGPAGIGLAGDWLLHLDLHPLNVVLTTDGPVLLDWANARAGPPEADLAMTWIILATSSVEGPARWALSFSRRRLLAAFFRHADRAAAAAVLAPLVDRRLSDRHVRPDEVARLHALRARASR